MSNKQYDTLKAISLIAVPVLAFVASLCNIWQVPHTDEIVATLTAIDTLLGAVVVAAAKAYGKKEESQ